MANETWQADGAHSAVGITVRHIVISKVRGSFSRWSAKLLLDSSDLTRSTVEVEIEAASIETGVADRDAHLRSAEFLDVEKHPSIRYRSRRVRRRRDRDPGDSPGRRAGRPASATVAARTARSASPGSRPARVASRTATPSWLVKAACASARPRSSTRVTVKRQVTVSPKYTGWRNRRSIPEASQPIWPPTSVSRLPTSRPWRMRPGRP